MTSLVRSLKRAVSSSRESDSSSPQTSPMAGPQRTASLAASPSFSDFSLNAHTDAENEFAEDKSVANPTRRSSLEEFLPSTPRWLRSDPLRGAPKPSATLPITRSAEAVLPSKLSAPAQGLPRRREGKISGMDYYDYCELIRSSSL